MTYYKPGTRVVIVYPHGVRGGIQHNARRLDDSEVWGTVSRIIGQYRDLDLDPPADVLERWEAGCALRAEAGRGTDSASIKAELVASLASGAIDGTTHDKRLAALPDADDLAEQRQARIKAATVAWRQAFTLLHGHGDALLDPLRKIVVDGIEQASDRTMSIRYEKAHQLADVLRQHGIVPSAQGADPHHYRYGAPDLVHEWLLYNSRGRRLRYDPIVENGVALEEWVPIDPPQITIPTVHVYRDEWQPGLYTADEVVANVRAIDSRTSAAVAN